MSDERPVTEGAGCLIVFLLLCIQAMVLSMSFKVREVLEIVEALSK